MIEFKESFLQKNEKYLHVFNSTRFLKKYISNTFFEMRTTWLGYDLDTTGWVAVLSDCHRIVSGLITRLSMHKP